MPPSFRYLPKAAYVSVFVNSKYSQNSVKEKGKISSLKVRPVNNVAKSELKRKALEPVI